MADLPLSIVARLMRCYKATGWLTFGYCSQVEERGNCDWLTYPWVLQPGW